MQSHFAIFSLLIATLPSILSGQEVPKDKGKNVPLLVSWQGEIKVDARKDGPPPGYILDLVSWDKMWNSWRPTEQKPTLNFDEVLVVVAVGSDPNKIAVTANLTEQGDLLVQNVSTLLLYQNPQTCAYHFAVIRKQGIKTIDGKPLSGK